MSRTPAEAMNQVAAPTVPAARSTADPAQLAVADADASRRPNLLAWTLCLVVGLLSPALTAYMIYRYGVDAPHWDEIALSPFIVKTAERGYPVWSDLWALHNESRMVVPRLVHYYFLKLAHDNQRWEMGLSYLMVAGTLAGVGALLRNTFGANSARALALTALASLLIFTPAQWENFLWGFQLQLFVSVFTLVAGMLALRSRRPLGLRGAAAFGLALIASCSCSNGLIVLALLLPSLALAPHATPRARAVAAACWLGATAVWSAYFFHGYVRPDNLPAVDLLGKDRLAALGYVLAFMGNALRVNANLQTAISLGATLLLLTAALSAYVAVRWRAVGSRALPWVVLAAYTLLSAAAAASGRVALGVDQALAPRYVTFGIPLLVALAPLLLICADDWCTLAGERRTAAGLAGGIGGALLALWAVSVNFVWPEMIQYSGMVYAGRAATQLALAAPDMAVLKAVIWPYDDVVDRITELDRVGRLRTGLVRATGIHEFAGDSAGISHGAFDFFEIRGGSLFCKGWSRLPDRGSPADTVLLTVRQADASEHIVGLAQANRQFRPDVAGYLGVPALENSGWEKEVDLTRLPPGGVVSAWAYDSLRVKAYRLQGEAIVPAR